jgi:DNA transformation protein
LVEFIVNDQLPELIVQVRPMFGGFGLYSKGQFFGIIWGGCLYYKTDESTRRKYIDAGSGPFTPTPGRTLKNYYAVPCDVIEDKMALLEWAREALSKIFWNNMSSG